MKKTARDRDRRIRGDEREVHGESVENGHAELAHRNEDDRRACQRRRSMKVQPGAAEAERKKQWNMHGSGWRRRSIGLATPPTLKPTRSHSESRWMSEANDTSATNETG